MLRSVVRCSAIAGIAILASIPILSQTALAQTALRQGVVQFTQIREMSQRHSTTLSYGTLAQLQSDPNFTGSLQTIVNAATDILNGYTIVNRGGYFPENAGIPRDRQLTRAEAVYEVFSLDNGNELVLFRSPLENTAQYFIRTPNDNL
ncbi:MAG TPA: hypothetical protein V6C78_05095 [Crinalium sp.]|jgi:hypothetical protein